MTGPLNTHTPALHTRTRPPGWTVVLACAIWFGLWYLTPGLLANGAGRLFTTDPDVSVLIETILAFVLAVALVLTHRRFNRVLFARSWSRWLYAVPVALAVTVPFRYELLAPVGLYMVWMTVSVFWQNYLTFGLLQGYLGERLPAWGVLVVSAVMFWLGHVLFIPDHFAPVHVGPSLAILVLGFVLGSLRLWLRTLHLILALHLSYYFVFVA